MRRMDRERPRYRRNQYRFDRVREELRQNSDVYFKIRGHILSNLLKQGKKPVKAFLKALKRDDRNFVRATIDMMVENGELIHVETLKPASLQNRVVELNDKIHS
jgi:hypothetical protein